jgi:protein ImuB
MPLAEAEALVERPAADVGKANWAVSEASFESLDEEADIAGLRKLSATCERFTPQFGIEESESPESLLLDVTGCTHLFGGDQQTATDLANDFQTRGFQARIGVTSTVGAAWAASRFLAKSTSPAIVPPTQLRDVLPLLPIESLRLNPAIIGTLHELGLRTVGQLRALPRSSLPSRFGPLLLKRLDQAFGDEPELFVPEKTREPLIADWAGEFPITDRESLHVVVRELLDQVLKKLNPPFSRLGLCPDSFLVKTAVGTESQPTRTGVRRLRCDLRDTAGRLQEFHVGFVAPTDHVKHAFEMLCLQWERAALPQEIAFVHLEATATDALHVIQRDLFGHELDSDCHRDVVTLLDRLSNRLGSHAVVRARLLPEAQPELAVVHETWTLANEQSSGSHRNKPDASTYRLIEFSLRSRPSRLLSPPEPIEVSIAGPEGAPLSFWWNRCEHRVIRSWGPERIEAGWWRESSASRDYFRVEVQTGHHFWIFRQLDDHGWLIHGTFD